MKLPFIWLDKSHANGESRLTPVGHSKWRARVDLSLDALRGHSLLLVMAIVPFPSC